MPLAEAAGRVLAEPVVARRDQPPFRASVMDGYAVRGAEVAVGARFRVIGEAPAGRAFSGVVGPGEAVRIFTGAPMPAGTDHVVIQEDVARDGDWVTLTEKLDPKPNVREVGADFRVGDRVEAPRRLGPAELALIAAMNVPRVTVRRRPVVAILPTGDELVMPGGEPRADQIVASNGFALKAMLEAEGAFVRMLPIAGDTPEALAAAFRLAEGADMLLTIGGASVGDYDLVGAAAEAEGVEPCVLQGRHAAGEAADGGTRGADGDDRVAGQSRLGHRLRDDLRASGGAGDAGAGARAGAAAAGGAGGALEANGPREHYMRAVLGEDGLRAMESQDSSLLGILARSNALIVRPVDDPARAAGEVVEYLPLNPNG